MRTTGEYKITRWGDEEVRAFIPFALPPRDPPLLMDASLQQSVMRAEAAVAKLAVAADMVPSADWFIYGFVRKEAVITSQIEGTQATLQDVLNFEAGENAEHPDDIREVCNYIEALDYARLQLAKQEGLPLATRLLCEAHRRLMEGTRGEDKQPGEVRRSQNWVGGSRPGNARYVPPPPEMLQQALSELEKWIHSADPLPPLVRIGMAHVQFESIHPFLDGNGRIGRLLIALLAEHWGLLSTPLPYVSLSFKRHRQAYYDRLMDVRERGDWEGWTRFFLDCVTEAAENGVSAAKALFALTTADRNRLAKAESVSIGAMRLFEMLPRNPMVTLALATKWLGVSKPTAIKAMDVLQQVGILKETTGKRRDRVYAYQAYLQILTNDTE
jgi:Fic family protein